MPPDESESRDAPTAEACHSREENTSAAGGRLSLYFETGGFGFGRPHGDIGEGLGGLSLKVHLLQRDHDTTRAVRYCSGTNEMVRSPVEVVSSGH